MTPTRFNPICAASLILCDSPPDRVAELLFKLRYSRPTFSKKIKRSIISLIILLEINCCCLLRFKDFKNFIASEMDRSPIS